MNARVCAVNVIQIREDVVCRLKDTPLYTNIAVIYKYKETSANAFELSLANNNEIYDVAAASTANFIVDSSQRQIWETYAVSMTRE